MEKILLWSDVFNIPHPQWFLSIFWQTLILFWKQEMNPSLEFISRLPNSMNEVQLSIHPHGFSSRRYHIYSLSETETTGIWDESPFNISILSQFKDNPPFLEHGINHSLSSFLKDIWSRVDLLKEKDPQFDLICKMFSRTPIFQQSCSDCDVFLTWSEKFLEEEWKDHKISFAPSVLLFLLQYKNKRRLQTNESIQIKKVLRLLEKTIHEFIQEFFKIQEQTMTDPKILIQEMIDILENQECTLETLEKKEEHCSQEIKAFLFSKVKYIKTKSIDMTNFPRLLLIAREAFQHLIQSFTLSPQTGFVGHLLLMNYLFFEDRSLSFPPTEEDLVVFHSLDGSIVERYFTKEECEAFNDYHPLLRPSLFHQETDN